VGALRGLKAWLGTVWAVEAVPGCSMLFPEVKKRNVLMALQHLAPMESRYE